MTCDICGAQLRYGAADIIAGMGLCPLTNGTGVLLELQILQNVISLLNSILTVSDDFIQGVLVRLQTLFEI